MDTRSHNALNDTAKRLLDAPDSAASYEDFSRVIFAEPDAFSTWEGASRTASLATLITQIHCTTDIPIFAQDAASNLTSGNRNTVTIIVNALRQDLPPLLNKDHGDTDGLKYAVLFALTVRAVAGAWLNQTHLQGLHLKWFAKFSTAELTLPYSVMFNPDLFGQNRDEILAELWPGTDAPTHLPPDRLLLLNWLSGKPAFKDRSSLAQYLARPHAPDQIKALRTLALRYGDQDTQLPNGDLGLGQIRAVIDTAPLCVEPPQSHFHTRSYQARQVIQNKLSNALPFLSRSDRKRRVAICISGQLRGYEQALSSWRQTLLGQVDATFFVQSWKKIGRADAQPFRAVLPFAGARFSEAYREVALAVGINDMRATYPALFRALDDGATATTEQIKALYETDHVVLDDETQSPFSSYNNQQKMHAKIYAADQMAHNIGDFDLHIRLRPDLDIALRAFNWHDIYQACHAERLMFTEKPYGLHYGRLMIGDQFGLAAPSTMARYTATWLHQPRLSDTQIAGCPAEFTGHISLALCSWLAGIHIEKAPLRFGQLREASPLSNVEIREALAQDAPRTKQTEKLIAAVEADLAQ